MAKRKMVYNNLVKNSISAYFAAVELHNKPNIAYRYETVTLLMMNAWELALKAYVKKNIKNRSIFTEDGHTISIEKALSYTTEHTNSKKPGSFSAVQRNILEIEKYRNGIAHFYCDQLEPYIFMLTAKSALNYVSFMKEYFGKDIMADDGLFILPLGFKLPFDPVDFLSGSIAKYASSNPCISSAWTLLLKQQFPAGGRKCLSCNHCFHPSAGCIADPLPVPDARFLWSDRNCGSAYGQRCLCCYHRRELLPLAVS